MWTWEAGIRQFLAFDFHLVYIQFMLDTLINVNGQIVSAAEAKVPVMDRGFMYGDSLYEVVRTYGGKPFGIEEHLERLEKSAQLCQMKLGQTRHDYRNAMLHTLEAYKKKNIHSDTSEYYVRLMVSRGSGKIGFGLECVETPTQYFVLVRPLTPPTEEQVAKGMHLQVSKRIRNDPRALDPAMKSGNYLNSLLAYLEAMSDPKHRDFEDAILCNFDGHVTEGTTFNVGYIRRGILVTPPLDIGILDGITRRLLLETAREQGIETREVRFPKERLYEADEVWVSSTIKEIFPVTRVDGKKIKTGKPGPITLKLRQALHQRLAR